MKRFAFLSVGVLLMALVSVGDAAPDLYAFPEIANAPTGAVAAATFDSPPLYGYLNRIEIMQTQTATNSGFLAATGTVSLVVVTNVGGFAEFVLYTNSATTTGGRYPVRYPSCNSAGTELGSATNAWERYEFVGEIVRFRVNALNATNNNYRAKLFMGN